MSSTITIAAIDAAILPRPSDQRQVDLHLEQLAQNLSPEAMETLSSPQRRRCSPPCSAILPSWAGVYWLETDALLNLLTQDIDSVFNNVVTGITPKALESLDEVALMTALRRARRQVALIVATADIAGLWPLEKVTAALTQFAEIALQSAVCHLLRNLVADGRDYAPFSRRAGAR